MNLGAMSAGQQTFNWTGGSANAQYTYEIDATNGSGAAVSSTPYSVYTVEGVNVSGSSPSLNVAGYSTCRCRCLLSKPFSEGTSS